jgi:hypothetical protein
MVTHHDIPPCGLVQCVEFALGPHGMLFRFSVGTCSVNAGAFRDPWSISCGPQVCGYGIEICGSAVETGYR